MALPAVAVARQGSVAIVTLDSPPAGDQPRNLLDEARRTALANATTVLADDFTALALLFEGSGGVFACGTMPEGPPQGVGSLIAALRKPTVAWVNGECMDMGLEMALACDVRVASPRSTFAVRQVHVGLLPWDGGTQRLARLVGRGQALRLLLAGEVIDAQEAERIGLVERVGERDSALELATAMASGAPLAAGYTKEAALAGLDLTLEQGLRLEADLSVLLQSTDDRAAGLRAFLARQLPHFEGR
jgi:enoyl-CoA hydratase/carnithine racemase